jgi:hypothetical protein
MKNSQKIMVIVSLLLLSIGADSFAQVEGGSNFGASGYPSHNCPKPSAKKPSEPTLFKNEVDLDAYNHSVEIYNVEAKPYIDCMQKYINDSYKDMERIKEKAQIAIDEATRY